MSVGGKISTILLAVRKEDIEILPSHQRKRLHDLCLYIAKLCDDEEIVQKRSGVIYELRQFGREG